MLGRDVSLSRPRARLRARVSTKRQPRPSSRIKTTRAGTNRLVRQRISRPCAWFPKLVSRTRASRQSHLPTTRSLPTSSLWLREDARLSSRRCSRTSRDNSRASQLRRRSLLQTRLSRSSQSRLSERRLWSRDQSRGERSRSETSMPTRSLSTISTSSSASRVP